ncbi:gamma-glutamylcyclotransferase family protein [Halovivax cerinus]|uniref:Gamma-glutamylcyclotransferase n=1 Tax=Halovivax cerinus TaxID=1487865 RepID=A0ABD5NKZ7_9EURY|nr:gamma-glutamylcyclotransferase family protein [Halovivax cerinus]
MTAAHVCFVYGTLTDPDRVATVLGSDEPLGRDAVDAIVRGDATLEGLHRVEGEYPTLAPGGRVDGRLLVVDDTGLDALDEYEGVDRGLYARVAVPCSHPIVEDERVWTYVGDPERLDADAAWPGDGSFASRVRADLDDRDVVVGMRR